MKTYQRLLLFAIIVLGLTAVLSPWAALAWEHVLSARPEWKEFRYSFSRIFNRFFMISGIMLFFPCRRWLGLGPLNQLGLTPRTLAWHDLTRGFGLAATSMAALALIMSWLDLFTPFFRLSLAESLRRCAAAMLAAAAAGSIEELLFRGIIFKGLREELGRARAYLFAGLFFSAIHFVKPASESDRKSVV